MSAIDRRRFVQATGLALASAAVSPLPAPAPAAEPEKRFKKALGWDMIREDLPLDDKLRMVRDVGFEGVEMPAQHLQSGAPQREAILRACQQAGVTVHGIANASHAGLAASLEVAEACGATSVLWVVRHDPQASYMDQYRRTQEVLREAIPHAEKRRVPILIENVWASFLIEPLTMARYIDELDSPWVKSYFDVGNVMRWGWPQQWIEVLGQRISKIHIKEYSLKIAMNEGLGKGFNVPIGEGDIDWAAVRQQLEKVGFSGWATAEVAGGDRTRLAEIAAQMDRVLAL